MERNAAAGGRSVFFSYAREDARLVDWLRRWLEHTGWTVWIDHLSIRGGAQWAGEIEKAITSSSVVVLLLSSNSVGSQWVGSELSAAVDRRVPIVVVDVDDPTLPQSMQFLLRGRQRVTIQMDEGRVSQQSLAKLDDALIGALEEARGTNPETVKLALGNVLRVVGAIGFILAFASFVYLGYKLASQEFGAEFGVVPGDVPVLGGLQVGQAFFAIFGVALVCLVLAGIGQALRRSARLKGVTWDTRR